MNKMRTNRAGTLVYISVLVMLSACGAEGEEPEADIPDDIYEEDVWDDVDAEVRVAALRRDVRAEIRRLESLPADARESESPRIIELMSSLRSEWGKVEGGSDAYAKLEVEVEVLLEG